MILVNTIFILVFLFLKNTSASERCMPEEPCSLCMFHPRDCLGIPFNPFTIEITENKANSNTFTQNNKTIKNLRLKGLYYCKNKFENMYFR